MCIGWLGYVIFVINYHLQFKTYYISQFSRPFARSSAGLQITNYIKRDNRRLQTYP